MYFSAEHVEGRIDAFLDEFADILRSLSDEDFKSQVNNVFEMHYLSIHNCKNLAQRFKWRSPERATRLATSSFNQRKTQHQSYSLGATSICAHLNNNNNSIYLNTIKKIQRS